MAIKIDESLFGHIFSDAFLTGSYKLQGHSFRRTIGFLNQYMATLPSATIPDEVKRLQVACNKMVSYEEHIRGLSSEAGLSALANTIHQDISTLKPGEYLLMPGGWLNQSGGHAIIYQFSVNEEGDLLVSINNSGAGLGFHAKKSDKDKELYNPVLTYKIPGEKINDKENFTRIIEQLLRLQVPTLREEEDVGEKDLYQVALPQLEYLNGRIIESDSATQDDWHTAGQLSGTCAQRSLHQMLKARFPSLDEYRRFIYNFKVAALDEYIAQLRQKNTLSDPKLQSQIKKAIRHSLRLLNLFSKENPEIELFTLAEKEQGIAKLTGYLTELRQCEQAKTPPKTKTAEKAYAISIQLIKPKAVNPGKSDPSAGKRDVQFPLEVAGGQSLLTDMNHLLVRCNKLRKSEQDQALFEQLEHFFLNAPLPDTLQDQLLPYYSTIDSEERALAFYKKINALQDLYFQCCDRLMSDKLTLARMFLTKFSLNTMVAHINQNNRMTAPRALCFQDVTINALSNIIQDAPHMVYLANHSPAMDARLNQIRALYSEKLDPDSNRRKMYYLDLIKTYPDLKKLLESRYLADTYGEHHSTPGLDAALRKEDMTSVYYFFEHIDQLKKDKARRFAPLLAKFEQQKELEKATTYYSLRLQNQIYNTSNKDTSFSTDFLNNHLNFKSIYSEHSAYFTINKSLQSAQYTISDSAAAVALKRSSALTANQIQLTPYEVLAQELYVPTPERPIGQTDLAARELFHLKISPASQIPLTLEYFKLHLEKLAQSELQTYLEANLFQPGLLIEQLAPERQESFFALLDSLIHDGLSFYNKKERLSTNSLFFIRLGYLVTQYAVKLDPETYQPRLNQYIAQLDAYLAITSDETIKATLHQYRFLALTTHASQYGTQNERLADATRSYFYTQSKGSYGANSDTHNTFQILHATHDFIRQLEQQKDVVSASLLFDILEKSGIPVDSQLDRISSDYPIFSVYDHNNKIKYTINAERGLVFKGGWAYAVTPLNIMSHPLVQQLGLAHLESCFVSPDGTTFLIERPPLAIRFIRNKDHYHIQQRFTDSSGQEAWYQLAPLSEAQVTHLELNDNDLMDSNLPEIFKERGTLAWVREDRGEFLLTKSDNKPWYYGTYKNMFSPWVMQSADKKERLHYGKSWMTQACAPFENAEFIETTEQEEEYTVRLPRYGLDFSAPKNKQALYFNWDGKRYQLDEQNPQLGDGITSLTFANDQERLCILPIQPFINTSVREETGEYYRLQQDINHKIPSEIVKNIINKDDPQLWQYSGTAEHLVLKIKNGEPVPQTPAQALYLCYVYLGSNQPEKAWKALELCEKQLGGLSGTYEEIRHLNWICNALPFQLEKEDSDAVISNPQFVACKLKALALIANVPPQKRTIAFPEPQADSRSANGLFEQDGINQTKTFYNTLNDEIYALYTRMQAMRREMPGGFDLSDAECKSLLNYYHDHLPDNKDGPKALGALGYEWVRLHLNVLRQEWATITAKERSRALTPYEQRRKQEISDFITQHDGIAATHSELEYLPINLDLSTDSRVDEKTLSPKSIAIINAYSNPPFANLEQHSTQIPAALQALTAKLSDDAFIQYMPCYLLIAQDRTSPHREQLMTFCQTALIAFRNQPKSNRFRLCNMLYRLLGAKKQPMAITNYYELVAYTADLEPQELLIPQLVDKTTNLLIKTEVLWQNLPEPKLTKTSPVVNKQALEYLNKLPLFSAQSSPQMLSFQQEWHDIATQFHSGVEGQESVNELQAGAVKYQALGRMQALAKQLMGQAEYRDDLAEKVGNQLEELKTVQDELSQQLLLLANLGPANAMLRHTMNIDIAAEKRTSLDMNHLLSLYFHEDQTRYLLETGLSEEQIDELHTGLTRYVAQALKYQQLSRVQEQCNDWMHASSPNAQDQIAFQLAQNLFAENLVDVVNEPALSLFQYQEHILLKTQQKEAIGRLLTTPADEHYREIIEKIIMGGGKSKVLLPTLAQSKATGSNLVIIEVPRALLQTNYVDLKATSLKLFKQDAFIFEFSRDTECAAMQLERLYDKLTDVMVNKNYLVTTGDALQSLELKYLELLANKPEENESQKERMEEWQQQIYWLDKLVLLFRNKGDLIIDEVHQGLLLKNKLNYTVGESIGVPKFSIKDTIKLYQFFKYVPLNLEHQPAITLDDVLKNNKLITSPEEFKQACVALATQLIHHENSPLHSYVEEIKTHYGDEGVQELEAYLLNTATLVPDFIHESTPILQNTLALYKEQINQLLPRTLKRNQGEHYGPSHITKYGAAIRNLALPYIANNTPNERSRFGNYLESLNYTIQSLIITGIPKDLLHQFMEELQTQALREMHEQGSKTTSHTPSSHLFKDLVPESSMELGQIDLEDTEQLDQIYQMVSRNETAIYEILGSNVLENIRINENILHSDAYNHVDLVRSCQGMTGTPSNHSTFHQRLHYDNDTAKGSDGYVIAGIRAKKPEILALDFTNTASFVNDLFASYQANATLRAIIDVSATFKGVSNELVAQTIGHYIQQHPEQFTNPAIQYILFFNAHNQLSAIRIMPDPEFSNQTPIILSSSDPKTIKERLGCDPDACFTFYDQSHTLGTDIKQDSQAKALVMVDHDTPLSSFLQGAMRMRGLLESNQTIDLVVPDSLGQHDFNELIDIMEHNESRQLQQDNFNAALLRMTNVIRSRLLQHVLAIQGEGAAEKKHALFVHFKAYFIEQNTLGFFSRYGGLNHEQNTADLLIAHQNKLLNDWDHLLTQASLTPAPQMRQQISKQLESIVEKACVPGVCAPSQTTRHMALGTETEVQLETQVETFAENETLRETYSPSNALYPYTQCSIDMHYLYNYHLMKTLTELCELTHAAYIPEFSPQIDASVNFYRAHFDQKAFIGMYQKPVHALYFRKKPDGLKCTLLTQEEFEELRNYPFDNSWISTTQHTVLAGTAPENLKQDPEYQSIIEQVRFFNGELSLLIPKDAPAFHWLNTESKEKLQFFEQYLQNNHETVPIHLRQLKTMLSNEQKIFQLLMNTPTIDRTNFDWRSLAPECDDDECEHYLRLSKAFNRASQEWLNEPKDPSQWQEEFNLPLKAMNVLTKYLNKLALLKALFAAEEAYSKQEPAENFVKEPILSFLSPDQYNALIQQFPAANVLTTPSPSNLESACQNIILLTFLINALPQNIHTGENPWLAFLTQLNNTEHSTAMSELKKYPNIKMSKDILQALIRTESISETMLLELEPIQFSGETLVILSQRQHLSEELTLRIIKHRTVKIYPEILKNIAKHTVSDQILQSLINKKAEDLSIILAVTLNPAASETSLRMIIKTYKEHPEFELIEERIVEHPQVDYQYLFDVATQGKQPAILHKLLTGGNRTRVDDAICLAIVNNTASSSDVLHTLSQHEPLSEEVLLRLTHHPLVKNHTLELVAAKTQSPQTLKAIAAKDDLSEAILIAMLNNPVLPKDLLQAISMQYELTEPLMQCLVNHALEDDNLLLNIVNRTRKGTVLHELVTGKNQGKLNEPLILALIKNTAVSDQTLRALSTRADISEEVFNKIVINSKARADTLALIAAKTQSDQTLQKILTKKINNAGLLAIANNTAASAKTINKLGKQDRLSEEVLLVLGMHSLTKSQVLASVASQTKRDQTLNELLKITDPLKLTDAVRVIIANNKAASESTLQQLTTHGALSEDAMLAIAQHAEAGLDSLMYVATHATRASTLETINTQVTNSELLCAMADNKNVSEMTLMRLSKQEDIAEQVHLKSALRLFALRFDTLVDELEGKTAYLVGRGESAASYKRVGNLAKNLISNLKTARNEFLQADPMTLTDYNNFKLIYTELIKTADNEFKKHRGVYHKLHPLLKGLLGVLAVITIIPALIIAATKQGYINTFFKTPPTKATKEASKFTKRLGEEERAVDEVAKKRSNP